MHESEIKRSTLRLLKGIEEGQLNVAEAYDLALELDPVLVYWTVRYLRDKYPPSHQSSTGIIERLVGLSTTYPDFVAYTKKGEKDLVSQWFSESFQTSEFFRNAEGMVGELVDKLEG